MEKYCKTCVYKMLPYYEKNYLSNQVVFLEGDKLNLVYRIEEGYVKMHRYLESGDDTILSVLGPGDYIALLAVLQEQTEYIASASTLTKTLLRVIDVDAVKKAYSSNASFKENCINCAVTRTHFFQFQMTQLGNNNTEDKILSTLINLQKKFGNPLCKQKTMTLPFSKTVLASLVGIRRETLSRHLTLMQNKGIIEIKKNQYIFL